MPVFNVIIPWPHPVSKKNDNFSFFNLILLAMSFAITFLVASLARISWNWRHHNNVFCCCCCFFHMTLTIHRTSLEEECHFWFLSTTSTHFEHLPISRTVTAESSPLHIASGRIRKGNLWFPNANCWPQGYASMTIEKNICFFFALIFYLLETSKN